MLHHDDTCRPRYLLSALRFLPSLPVLPRSLIRWSLLLFAIVDVYSLLVVVITLLFLLIGTYGR